MYFAFDAEHQFYYLGDVAPHKGMYQEYLTDRHPLLIGVDTETISLKERIAIGIGIAVEPNIGFYFPLFPKESVTVPWHLLKDPNVTQVYHNGMFDLACLREYNICDTNVMDTNIMSRLLCYKYNGLSDLTWIHKTEVYEVKELLAKYNAKLMLDLPPNMVARKCIQDACATLKLYYEFLPQMDLPYLKTEMETIPIMLRMSERGLKIDQEIRIELEEQLTSEVETYLEMCEELEAFNPGSPQQVAYILAKRGSYNVFSRLPFTRNKYGRHTTTLSTAKEILEYMEDPLAQLILSFREKSKLLCTYIKPWSGDDRAFTRYHLDAITGRPSSTDRNMQNIPGANSRGGINVRAMFLPDSGVWTDVDFSQTELRVLAYLSQDREMLHIYESDGDIHQIAADFMGIDRKIAKNVSFAMIYGGTVQTLMETAHIKSMDRAAQLKEMWFQLFPRAADLIQTLQHDSLVTGRAKTVFGREIRLPTQDEEGVDAIHRKAVNYPIQATAAEIMKRALILCQGMDMALQVHDEILIDGIVTPDMFECLEHIAPFKTPVSIKYLERWE